MTLQKTVNIVSDLEEGIPRMVFVNNTDGYAVSTLYMVGGFICAK